MSPGPRRGRGGNRAPGRPDGPRRLPPPERTGLEPAFLGQLESEQGEIVIHLRGGEALRGTIEGFDREMILLRREDGRTEAVRKSTVRYLEQIEPEAPTADAP